jgi:hypothetical protein
MTGCHIYDMKIIMLFIVKSFYSSKARMQMNFGDNLRNITKNKQIEKANQLSESINSLPQLWVDENLDIIRAGMIKAAENGDNKLQIGISSCKIGNSSARWKSVSDGNNYIDEPYLKDYADKIRKILEITFKKENIKLVYENEIFKHKGKSINFTMWNLVW